MSSPNWNSERSSRFQVIFLDAKWALSFASSAIVPVYLDVTRGGPSLWPFVRARAAGIRTGLCQTAKTAAFMPAYYSTADSKCNDVLIWPSGEMGAGGFAFCYLRNTKGPRGPGRKSCLILVELYLSRRS